MISGAKLRLLHYILLFIKYHNVFKIAKNHNPPQLMRIVSATGDYDLLYSVHYHAGTRHIQAHESLTTRTKHFTIIQCQMSLVDKKVRQLFMVEMQIPTVEPNQEGSLRTQRTRALRSATSN